MAKLLAEEGINVMIDATANRRRYRDLARQLIPNFAEVFIRAPLEICRTREAKRKAKFSPKDIYKKAAERRRQFRESMWPMRSPLAAEIVVDTTENERGRECQVS